MPQEQNKELDAACETLARHLEANGQEVIERHFVKDGRVICSVWCFIGQDVENFDDDIRKMLISHGYK